MDKGTVRHNVIIENVPTSKEAVTLPLAVPQQQQQVGSQLAAQIKRKDKARIAARARRSQEATIIMEMANELHITQEKIKRTDKATIVKLAIDYIKAFEILCRFRSNCGNSLTINNNDDYSVKKGFDKNNIDNNDHDNDFSIRRKEIMSKSCISQISNSNSNSNSENSCISKRNINYDNLINDNDNTSVNITPATFSHANSCSINNHNISHSNKSDTYLNICMSSNCNDARCNHNDIRATTDRNTLISAQQQPLRQKHEQQQSRQKQITTQADKVASNQNRSAQVEVIRPPIPKLSTGSIFAPKTDDMDLYFLMINDSDGKPSYVLKPDNEILEEDDLTHLAPQAGDSSIPLEVEPLDGIVLDTSLFNSGSPPMKKAPLMRSQENHPLMANSSSIANGLIDNCCIIGTGID